MQFFLLGLIHRSTEKVHKSEYIYDECCAGAAHKCGANMQRLAGAGVGHGEDESCVKTAMQRRLAQGCHAAAAQGLLGRAPAAHFKAAPPRREVLDAADYKARRQTVNEPRCKLLYAYV